MRNGNQVGQQEAADKIVLPDKFFVFSKIRHPRLLQNFSDRAFATMVVSLYLCSPLTGSGNADGAGNRTIFLYFKTKQGS